MAKVLTPKSNGLTIKKAIVIEAKTLDEGIKEEYRFLERKFGKRGKDWQVFAVAVDTKTEKSKGKFFDVLYVGFPENKRPDWKPDPEDFLTNFFRPFYFLVITPKDKYRGNAEKIRKVFRPEKVKVLLVGESPPPEEWKFFYNCNSDLYDATKEVFRRVLGRSDEEFDNDEFLTFFESKGFYLVDLFQRKDIWKKKNGNFEKVKPSERLIKRRIKELKKIIDDLKPEHIVAIGSEYVSGLIRKYDKDLYRRIDWKLPVPKGRYKKKFIEEFVYWLKRHMKEV